MAASSRATSPAHAATGIGAWAASHSNTAPSAAQASVIHCPPRARGTASVRNVQERPSCSITVAASSGTRAA